MRMLKRSLEETAKGIKGNKLLFTGLAGAEILFIVSVFLIGITYQVKIGENIKVITESLESLDYEKYDVSSAEELEGPAMQELMKKMVLVTKSYEEMVGNILKMIFLMAGNFLLFGGLGWSLANRIIYKKGFWGYWGKFIVVSVSFLGPFCLAGYGILRGLAGRGIGEEGFKLAVNILGGVFLVLAYFMLAGFGQLEGEWKGLLKRIFWVGIKRAHWLLPGLAVVLLATGLSLVLVYFSLGNFWLMILGGLGLVVVLAAGKVFLVGMGKELGEGAG